MYDLCLSLQERCFQHIYLSSITRCHPFSASFTPAYPPPQKIEEQRVTIEDLEALKELTDELEENHIQVERELRDEILDREKDLREEKVRVGLLEDIVSDADVTIARFREVVADMQGWVSYYFRLLLQLFVFAGVMLIHLPANSTPCVQRRKQRSTSLLRLRTRRQR